MGDVNKYHRPIRWYDEAGVPRTHLIDVYDVLKAFGVTCPARQHAIKKLLCAGLRGKGDSVQDLKEAVQAVERSVELERETVALAEGGAA